MLDTLFCRGDWTFSSGYIWLSYFWSSMTLNHGVLENSHSWIPLGPFKIWLSWMRLLVHLAITHGTQLFATETNRATKSGRPAHRSPFGEWNLGAGKRGSEEESDCAARNRSSSFSLWDSQLVKLVSWNLGLGFLEVVEFEFEVAGDNYGYREQHKENNITYTL